MTDTRAGGTQARSTVFSLLVWLTHTQRLTPASTHFNALFMRMDPESANPNSEWSVNTVCAWQHKSHKQAKIQIMKATSTMVV
jgi:hypothetical protein